MLAGLSAGQHNTEFMLQGAHRAPLLLFGQRWGGIVHCTSLRDTHTHADMKFSEDRQAPNNASLSFWGGWVSGWVGQMAHVVYWSHLQLLMWVLLYICLLEGLIQQFPVSMSAGGWGGGGLACCT